MRLERVPGGLRLAEWAGGELRRRAPVLAADDLPALVRRAPRRGRCSPRASWRASRRAADDAVSRGRSGELRDELRVEPLDGDRVRIGRWLFRPGTRLGAPGGAADAARRPLRRGARRDVSPPVS